jgi:mono/diheme cytochrome c family protein
MSVCASNGLRKGLAVGAVTALASVVIGIAGLAASTQQDAPTDDRNKGWTIPADGPHEQNPIAASPEVLQKGEKLYRSKCQRCHGKEGKGDGPDADHEKPAGNFTDRMRVAFNPDGVMFYKVWNGRSTAPKMPAFKSEGLSKDEVWTVIRFVNTLRK